MEKCRADEGGWAAALFIISFVCYAWLVLAGGFPFVYDEGSWSLMIKEFSDDPGKVMPTIAGEHVEWKPPLFSWVGSVFYALLKGLPLPLETVFRLPSALFGAGCVWLVFMITRLAHGRDVAAVAAVLFMTCPMVLFFSSLAMMETFTLFLVLCSIYFYMRRMFGFGMLFLGMVVLAKWLYFVAPALFVALYFLKDRDLGKALASFVVIPVAVAAYLLLASAFGSLDNAVANLLLDLSRPSPDFSPLWLFLNTAQLLWASIPLSIVFAASAIGSRDEWWEERAAIAMGALAFLLLFAHLFIFWYCIVSVPAWAMFVAKKAGGMGDRRFMVLIACILVALNLTVFWASPVLKVMPVDGTEDVAEFMQGRGVQFLEPRENYVQWGNINEIYMGTNRSYLLLEQNNPGIMFYRFGEAGDYGNMRAVFSSYGEAPECEGYLVLHRSSMHNATAPECFKMLWEVGEYAVYQKG